MPGSGDTCPNCRRGRMHSARAGQPYAAICPRCCHTEYAGGGA